MQLQYIITSFVKQICDATENDNEFEEYYEKCDWDVEEASQKEETCKPNFNYSWLVVQATREFRRVNLVFCKNNNF